MTTSYILTAGNENWTISNNGATLYIAGNDGVVEVRDAQTGALQYSASVGINLGALALSPDGMKLAVIEEVPANVHQVQNWTENSADVSMYVIDLNTFNATKYTFHVTGSNYTFADVAWSDNDTLQISRNILPGWSGWAPLATLELANGQLTEHGSYYAGLGSAASLLTMPNSSTVLLGQLGLSSATYYLIGPDGTSTVNNGTYNNNVYGYAGGIEAASGSTSNDRIVIVTGGSAHLYDGTMTYIGDLSDLYPSLGNAMGVGFSPDGSRLFFLDAQNHAIVVIDAYNYNLVGTADISGVSFNTLKLGAEVIVAADGRSVYFNTTTGIASVTLDLPDVGTSGNDTIIGTAHDDVLDGKGGDDTLSGLSGDDWLIGGPGNDIINGGTDFDIAAYETATSGVTVDLGIYTAQNTGGAGFDTLAELEGLSGSLYADTLYGDAGGNLLLGYSGNDQLYGRGGDDELHGENGNDSLYGEAGNDYLFGEAGNDLLDGGTGADRMEGGDGDDIYVIDNVGDVIVETASGGNDTMRVYNINAIIAQSVETLIIMQGAVSATGNFVGNTLIGSADANTLNGLAGNDKIDGGGNIDTAVFSGNRSAYTVTQTSFGNFSVSGPDGTDTLSNIEYLKFDDQTLRLRYGSGTTVDFSAAPSTYMGAIRDFSGNDLGGADGWKKIGAVDINGDGDVDQILVNKTIGRFAEVGTAPDGKVYFGDYGWAGETRVVGTYIDPLVQSGQVQAGSDNDSQRRFQNDLQIENINKVLGAGDYDHDGLQEVYFGLTDGTAYLHAYMHADGNIRYANYQSQQQVIDYLASNGWAASTYDGWFA